MYLISTCRKLIQNLSRAVNCINIIDMKKNGQMENKWKTTQEIMSHWERRDILILIKFIKGKQLPFSHRRMAISMTTRIRSLWLCRDTSKYRLSCNVINKDLAFCCTWRVYCWHDSNSGISLGINYAFRPLNVDCNTHTHNWEGPGSSPGCGEASGQAS